MPSSLAQERERRVADALGAGRTTVLVIGGGINGIGTFRELALEGVDVILVERGDFASGATSASSHMVHGGIRYLENGELRLVRESVQERNRMLRLAPHRVKPLRTTIPIFSTFSGILSAPLRLLTHRQFGPIRERGALLIKVGLVIYDIFSRGAGSVPLHRFAGRKRSLAEVPALDKRVKYTATYYDAVMEDPERLALDVLSDALNAGPHAKALNYVEAIGASAAGVTLRDIESGREFSVRADVIVNTSGAWTDLTNDDLGRSSSFMGGTKGSHVVVDDAALLGATSGREIFFENEDGRIVLILPLHGRVIVGTTDLDADPRVPVACTDEEIEYFIGLVRRVFPEVPLRRDRIVHTFAGIRPLPHHDDLRPGLVSRDFRIEVTMPPDLDTPVLSLVGGKWTTFRAQSEKLADEVLARIGQSRSQSTADLTLGNAIGLPTPEDTDEWLAASMPNVPLPRARVLLARYGASCVDVAAMLGRGDTVLVPDELSTGELEYMVRVEYTARLSDVVLRRTNLGFRGEPDAAGVARIAEALGKLLGWSAKRARAEVDETVALLGRPV